MPSKIITYKEFLSKEIPKWKKANPTKKHAEAFTAVAKSWAKSPLNPKNKK